MLKNYSEVPAMPKMGKSKWETIRRRRENSQENPATWRAGRKPGASQKEDFTAPEAKVREQVRRFRDFFLQGLRSHLYESALKSYIPLTPTVKKETKTRKKKTTTKKKPEPEFKSNSPHIIYW